MLSLTMPQPTPALVDAMRRINELLRAGGFQAAHDELAAIVEANPGYAEALRLLAGTKQALGDPTRAEQLLRQALALDPSWAPTLATLGELLLAGGRAAEAEPLLARAATAQPPYARAALLLARYYNDTDQPARALAVVAPLCLSGRADADLAAQHIAALAALGRAREAVAGYRRILAAAPDDPAAAQALAIALHTATEHEEAGRIAGATLARGYRSAALYHTYARSLIAQGIHERAEPALRSCLELEPRLVEAHNSLAQLVWMRSGDIAQATETLDRALATFANDEALWATKAAVLQGAGDARAAYACLAPWAGRAQAPPALLVRAGLAALEFDLQLARALAERALRRVPGNAAALTLLTAALLGIGDAQAALVHCETLLKQAPDDQYLIALETTAWRLLGDERYGRLCDYRKLVMPLALEPPPPWESMASFLADLKVSLDRLHDPKGHALLFQSLRLGTETTQDLSRSTDPAIRGLFSAFAAPIAQYLRHIGQGSDPLRRRNNGRWRFNGSWSVRLHRCGFHTNHTHPRGWISSACYIELPPGMSEATTAAGTLTFGEPGIATTPPLGADYSVRPQAGMLVLFPSYFWHGTVPFESDTARLTVAFDAVPSALR
jgi:tetratricopeptide (TPR) repeat protein